jgi:tRNA G10  N-methylase Trm11
MTLMCTQVFHAVIGDPPYGVRAGGRKSVAKVIDAFIHACID